MDLTALRSNSGIAKTNRQGRRPGKSACTACHIRKKRCDAAPPHFQCTFCRKEDQLCIPRDPAERPARHRIPNTKNLDCKVKTQKEKEIPLPPGIDHEIPRWSAMYSFYSEMQRLLPSPSLSPSPEIEDDTPPRTSNGKGKKPAPQTEYAQHEPESLNHDRVDEKFKGISMPASQTPGGSSAGQVDSEPTLGAAGETRSADSAGTWNFRHVGAHHDGFMDDLDALLRF